MSIYNISWFLSSLIVLISPIWIKTLNINPCEILANYKPNSIVKNPLKCSTENSWLRYFKPSNILNYLAIVIFEALWLQDLFLKVQIAKTIVRQYIFFFKLFDFDFLVHCWFKQLVGFHGCHMSKFVFGIEFIMLFMLMDIIYMDILTEKNVSSI